MSAPPLLQSDLRSLPLIGRGKVRDIYAVGDAHLLLLQSDRISAFDVVMDDPIPGKGEVLTAMAAWWFEQLADVAANHTTGISPEDVVAADERDTVRGRAMVVKKMRPLAIEAVARGYIIGSGWRDYQQSGEVCGIKLPPDLRLAEKLPEAIFTPATKATEGHDENIDFNAAAKIVGEENAAAVRAITLKLFARIQSIASARGIIVADTKFEFAIGDSGELVLIDEVATPDSSRFWPAEDYAPGKNPPSFDKQFLRDWLAQTDWDKTPPPPPLPPEIIAKTAARYAEIRERLLSGGA